MGADLGMPLGGGGADWDFHYAEILAAAVVSYFLFAHIPDFWVWPGFALIAGANTVVTLLEMREKKKAAAQKT